MSIGDSKEQRVRYVFVSGRDGEGTVMFEADEYGPPEQITLRTVGQSSDILMPVRLDIPLADTRDLYLRSRGPSEFFLTSQDHGPGVDPWVRLQIVPGPRERDETLHGFYYDPSSDQSFDFVAVTDPEPLITIIVIGAVVCLLKQGIEKLVKDCAEQCKAACQGSVKKCTVKSSLGVGWDKGPQLKCGTDCEAECD